MKKCNNHLYIGEMLDIKLYNEKKIKVLVARATLCRDTRVNVVDIFKKCFLDVMAKHENLLLKSV